MMQKTIEKLEAIQLVGQHVRTHNAAEMDPAQRKIGPLVQAYFEQKLGERIAARRNVGTTFCAYTAYEHDFTGNYTFLIGEEVSASDQIPETFTSLIIPAQTYIRFTRTGPMPNVCIEMWQAIWQMSAEELGGERAYIADFEIYDPRSLSRAEVIVDIYMGIRKELDTWVGETDIAPLLKAFSKFEKFRRYCETEQEKAGVIQAFEYCFELSWKIMKRLLQERGKTANSPRETFRMAALEGFIADPEIWFNFIKKRNLTVHTYHAEEANHVINVCASFAEQLRFFLKKIGFSLV